MAECPRFLQEAFYYWAVDGAPNVVIIEAGNGPVRCSWRTLCSQLRDCADPMPADLCEWFGEAPQTSYAVTARRLLREAVAPRSTMVQGMNAEGQICSWNGIEWVPLDLIDDDDPLPGER